MISPRIYWGITSRPNNLVVENERIGLKREYKASFGAKKPCGSEIARGQPTPTNIWKSVAINPGMEK